MSRTILGAVCALLLASAVSAQTVVPIPNLPSAALPVTGGELVPVWQGSGGKNIPISQMGRFGATGWLEPIYPFSETISAGESLSGTGKIGWLGASRCSDNPTAGDEGCIGSSSVVLNNNTSFVQYAWGHYVEARRYAGAGTTHGQETDIINEGSDVFFDPYLFIVTGQTSANWLSCGRHDVASSTYCGAALAILDNGGQFDGGIVFKSTALHNYGNLELAINLAQYQAIVFREPATDTIVGQIRSDNSTAGGGGELVFNGNGVQLESNTGLPRVLATTSGVNLFEHITLSSAGTAPTASACGTSPTVASGSTDAKITVTVGSGTVTTCTIAFATVYTSTPVCVATGSSGAGFLWLGVVNANGFVVGFSANYAGQNVYIHCVQ